ncbi:MAG: hypothetical protein ACRCZ9_03960 [Fusobacteriaceae bacterium]
MANNIEIDTLLKEYNLKIENVKSTLTAIKSIETYGVLYMCKYKGMSCSNFDNSKTLTTLSYKTKDDSGTWSLMFCNDSLKSYNLKPFVGGGYKMLSNVYTYLVGLYLAREVNKGIISIEDATKHYMCNIDTYTSKEIKGKDVMVKKVLSDMVKIIKCVSVDVQSVSNNTPVGSPVIGTLQTLQNTFFQL